MFLLGTMAASCGQVERDPDPAPPAPAPVDFATFVARWHDILCGEPVECRTWASEAECRSAASLTTSETERSVAEGRLAYDPAHGEVCLAAWQQAYRCRSNERRGANYSTVAPACSDAFRGTVPIGGVCVLDRDCQSGACTPDDMACIGCCASHCVETLSPPPKAIGEECVESNECGEGAECLGICVIKRPPPTRPDRGEPCYSVCDRTDDYCNSVSGICEPRLDPGQTCAWETAADDGTGGCVTYARCLSNVCVEFLPEPPAPCWG